MAASSQNQALSGILFLYKHVLQQALGDVVVPPRARMPEWVPVVLTPEEVRAVLAALDGVPKLVAMLLYGAGLRLQESLALRVKDIDLARLEITVRRGKGQKDRRVRSIAGRRANIRGHRELAELWMVLPWTE